jgi:serine/threonine/tyrosine protein kinase RAD53
MSAYLGVESVLTMEHNRLTNTSPFIDDDTQRDIRIRIAERRIDWSALVNPEAGLSPEGTHLPNI